MKLTFFGDTILQENDTIAFSKEFLKLVKQSDFNILNFEGTLKDSSSLPISKIGPNLYNSDKSIEILKENFFNSKFCFKMQSWFCNEHYSKR